MKKTLLGILAISLSIASCKKSSSKCGYCEMRCTYGPSAEVQTTNVTGTICEDNTSAYANAKNSCTGTGSCYAAGYIWTSYFTWKEL